MGTLKVDTIQDSGGNTILSSDGSGGFSNSLPAGKTSSYRNLIINGDMSIAQRGTSKTGVGGVSNRAYPTVDRFTTSGNIPGAYTVTQDTDVPTGQGFAKSLKFDCTTADATTGLKALFIQHIFEGQNLQHLKKGTSNAESVTISFWVKSNLTGDFTVELDDRDNTRHITALATINSANTWEKKTITFEGDTTGALDNDNNDSLRLNIIPDARSDFTSGTQATTWQSRVDANRMVGQTLSLASSTSNYLNLTGVQLEVGTSASDFEFLPYDVNLKRCYRYCQKWIPNSGSIAMRLGNGAIMDTANMYFVAYPSVEMRTKPSLTLNSTTDWRIFHKGLTATTTNLTFETHGTNQVFNFLATVSSGLTSGDCGQLIGNSAGNYALFDSEL